MRSAMSSWSAGKQTRKRTEPRVNARRRCEGTHERRRTAGDFLIPLGTRLMKAVSAASLASLVVGVCAGLVMVAHELGPMAKEWFAIRHVIVDGLHHVSREEIMVRLALKPETPL